MVPDYEEIDLQSDEDQSKQKIEEDLERHSSEVPTNKAAFVEKPYGWVIVFASFFVHFFVLGSIYSFGIFFSEYLDAFNADKGTVAWIGSIGAGLMTGLGAYTGSWADQYGNGPVVFVGGLLIGAGYLLASFSTAVWHLFVTQGFIAGIGFSLSFIAGVSVVGQWFSKNRGLAVGIAVAGSGLGQFCMTLITGALISIFGWRSALRILALIITGGLTLSSSLIRRNVPCYKQSKENSAMKWFKNRNFINLYIALVLATLGLFMPFTHISQYAIEEGVPKAQSVLLLAIMGIFSALGRVVIGFAADVFGNVNMLRVCTFGGGIATYCWISCTTFETITVYGSIFAFFAGGIISLMPAVCAALFGIDQLGAVLGLLYTASALGNLLSAPIGGFLYEINQNYTPSIAVAASFMMIGGIALLFVHKAEKEQPPVVVRSHLEPGISYRKYTSLQLSPENDSVRVDVSEDFLDMETDGERKVADNKATDIELAPI